MQHVFHHVDGLLERPQDQPQQTGQQTGTQQLIEVGQGLHHPFAESPAHLRVEDNANQQERTARRRPVGKGGRNQKYQQRIDHRGLEHERPEEMERPTVEDLPHQWQTHQIDRQVEEQTAQGAVDQDQPLLAAAAKGFDMQQRQQEAPQQGKQRQPQRRETGLVVAAFLDYGNRIEVILLAYLDTGKMFQKHRRPLQQHRRSSKRQQHEQRQPAPRRCAERRRVKRSSQRK